MIILIRQSLDDFNVWRILTEKEAMNYVFLAIVLFLMATTIPAARADETSLVGCLTQALGHVILPEGTSELLVYARGSLALELNNKLLPQAAKDFEKTW